MTAETSTDQCEVSVVGSNYRVINLGTGIHYVTKEKTCSCGDPNCPAIRAVADYLRKGGKRAPEFPQSCPICGASINRDPSWDFTHSHRPGWRCQKGGLAHFLEFNTRRIAKQFTQDPWLIQPVFANGTCVYPGVRREEMLSWEECNTLLREEYQKTGYDPRE